MSKRTIQAYIVMQHLYNDNFDDEKEWRPQLWDFAPKDTDARICIGKQLFEVDVPDDFNPVPHQVRALEEAKRLALEVYQTQVAELNERLSKLLSITN